MSNPFYSLIPFAIGAVAIVLVFGLVNMLRGGSPQLSQKQAASKARAPAAPPKGPKENGRSKVERTDDRG